MKIEHSTVMRMKEGTKYAEEIERVIRKIGPLSQLGARLSIDDYRKISDAVDDTKLRIAAHSRP